MGLHVVLYRDQHSEIRCVGPFKTHDDAWRYGATALNKSVDWWAVPLEAPFATAR